MVEEPPGAGGASEGETTGKEGPTEQDIDAEVDRFLDRMEDAAAIEARGEAAAGPGDAEYEERMNEPYRDQIEDEKEGLRRGGIDVDGTGQGLPLGSPPLKGPRYRPPEVQARERVESGSGGGEANLRAGEAVAAAPAGEPAALSAVGPGMSDLAAEKLVARLSEAHVAAMRTFGEIVRKEMQSVRELIPQLETDDVKALVGGVDRLGKFLQVQDADNRRRRELSRNRWKWPLRGIAVLAVGGVLVGGAVVQARLGVLGDGTNGWKDIVWQRHGIAIAECMKRASGRGKDAVCAVSATIR